MKFLTFLTRAKVPTVRWGYWIKVLRFLSDPAAVARLQQMLIWL